MCYPSRSRSRPVRSGSAARLTMAEVRESSKLATEYCGIKVQMCGTDDWQSGRSDSYRKEISQPLLRICCTAKERMLQ